MKMRGTYSKHLTILGHRRRFAMEEAASRAGVERLMCPNLCAESNNGGVYQPVRHAHVRNMEVLHETRTDGDPC